MRCCERCGRESIDALVYCFVTRTRWLLAYVTEDIGQKPSAEPGPGLLDAVNWVTLTERSWSKATTQLRIDASRSVVGQGRS